MPSSKKSLLLSSSQDSPCLVDNVGSLTNSIKKHVLAKKASFYTPGHKGYSWQHDGSFVLDHSLADDLSESVPGMDELAYPSGVLADLETRAAKAWGTYSTTISVNGATAGIIGSILMLAKKGTHFLVPRNCHRSVINGLILTGLQPVWYEPIWQNDWGFWSSADINELDNIIEKWKTSAEPKSKIAGLIVTSPTYAGALTDIKSLSNLLNKYNIPLVVDEAHGAHLLWTSQKEQAALSAGADIVVHSLHKTLSCPTQTGMVHISKAGATKYGFSPSELRVCLNLIQSSSPSYIFMNAIDKLVTALSTGKAQEQIQKVEELGLRAKEVISKKKDFTLYESLFSTVNTDILVKHKNYSAQSIQEFLVACGLFSETLIGGGVLFFLGIGSQSKDTDLLLQALDRINSQSPNGKADEKDDEQSTSKPKPAEQVLSPREAFFMPSCIVPAKEAIGQIAAECLAPCPPGWPVTVPGQRITEEILEVKSLETIRIVRS